jgi:hypothetical protein
LVIIAMQIRGRHRGLPYELDRAILLPSEHLQEKENADAAQRVRTRRSSTNLGGPVSSGAAKTERSMSRNRSPQRQAQNLLSTLLHPGPTIPNSHRNIHKGDAAYRRRHSIATTGMNRQTRSVSPRAMAGINNANTNFGIPLGDGANERRGRTEGRRSFYKEGVNPAPPDATPTSPKQE